MNENCWILVGEKKNDLWWGQRVERTEGEPMVVRFNPYYVLDHADKVVGFIHTHPNFSAHYSSRDDLTMKAWVTCLGKPLVCCIQGIDGLRAWWYLDDENPPEEFDAKAMRGIVFGVTPYEIIDEEPENSSTNPRFMPDLEFDPNYCFHCGKKAHECKCG